MNRLGGFDSIVQDELERRTMTQSPELQAWASGIARAAVKRSIGVHRAFIARELRALAVEAQSRRCGSALKAVLLALAKDFE